MDGVYVTNVEPSGPCNGLLVRGDRIVGINSRNLKKIVQADVPRLIRSIPHKLFFRVLRSTKKSPTPEKLAVDMPEGTIGGDLSGLLTESYAEESWFGYVYDNFVKSYQTIFGN